LAHTPFNKGEALPETLNLDEHLYNRPIPQESLGSHLSIQALKARQTTLPHLFNNHTRNRLERGQPQHPAGGFLF